MVKGMGKTELELRVLSSTLLAFCLMVMHLLVYGEYT